jgi:hypothetical protein
VPRTFATELDNGCIGSNVTGIGTDEADARMCAVNQAASFGGTLVEDGRVPVTRQYCARSFAFPGGRSLTVTGYGEDATRRCAEHYCGINCDSVTAGACMSP